MDVLCGRGGLSNKHFGNRLFRRLVGANQEAYHNATNPSHKQFLVMSIIQAIQGRNGQFIKQRDGVWSEISPREAFVKTSQALREQHDAATNRRKNRNTTKKVSDGKPKSIEPISYQTPVPLNMLELFDSIFTLDDIHEVSESSDDTYSRDEHWDDFEPIKLSNPEETENYLLDDLEPLQVESKMLEEESIDIEKLMESVGSDSTCGMILATLAS